ncbi:hypothetical protein CJ263_01425 [Maribacter cobaltidurans]|uniref:Uncharacterized protein n=1 Tax=Maribacter cobaltidurans TaxID=1178778 RepID=A0A223V0U7_9FLAO|nr:hypothetical protein CJ263_01425 [Maribacter cobaltidurans]
MPNAFISRILNLIFFEIFQRASVDIEFSVAKLLGKMSRYIKNFEKLPNYQVVPNCNIYSPILQYAIYKID